MLIDSDKTLSGRRVEIDPAALIAIEELTPRSCALVCPGYTLHVRGTIEEWEAWWMQQRQNSIPRIKRR